MENKKSREVDRRTVLKAIGGTTATTVVASGFAGAEETEPGQELAGKGVYVGEQANVELPADANEVKTTGQADVVIVGSETTLSRGVLTGALNTGKPVFVVGEDANETLMSMLYDVSKDRAAEAARQGQLTKPRDIQYTFGTETEESTSSYVTAAYPLEEPNRINTQRYQTNRERSNKYVLSKIDHTFRLNASHGASSDSVSIASHSAACESAQASWHCLGRTYLQKDYSPYGQIERWVWGAKATETDTRKDYYAWKVKQQTTPGIALGWSQWQNNLVERIVDFNDTHKIPKHGPPTTDGSSTSSFTVGVNVGITSDPSVGLGGNLGWGWSNTYGHTKISEIIDSSTKRATHRHELSKGKLVAKNTFNAYPGYQIEVPNNTSTVSHGHENKWKWVRDDPIFDNYYTVTLNGTATWNA
jgi:hypothetical protein